MCGIVGVVGALPTKEKIIKARERLKHRGPDGAGLYLNEKESIALGHRRLSIIDLTEAGLQPLFSNDGRFVVVYNGEIYNYIEIKKELASCYNFKTKTDTEVLLAAYIKWKERCLEKLNGMFAFAIWDKKKKELFCARDRLGIKPFFYCLKDNTLYFASEIKALFSLGIRPQANEGIIFDYLYHGFYDHREETFFRKINRLPSGSYLAWKDGKIAIRKYWDLEQKKQEDGKQSDGEIYGKFKELLADSIKLRFRSDVPVGVNLSSGLDSNALLFYSKQVTGEDVHTFSMCTPSEKYNECSLIERFLNAEQKKKWHKNYTNSREVFSLAKKMNKIQDEPYGGIPTIVYDALNVQAKKHGITVLLEGQGLDELLAGYKYYRIEYEKDMRREGGKGISHDLSSLNYSQDVSLLIDRTVLNSDFVGKHKDNELVFDTPFASHLLNAQYRDLVYTKLPRVLRFNDHVSMAHGIELRVPYLDHRMVEFCFSLPVQYKITKDSQKVLARRSLEEYLPQVIKVAPKKTFGAVQTEWLRSYNKTEVYQLIELISLKQRPYWNHKELRKKVDEFYNGHGENSFFLWQCINLELWFREFID